VEVAELLPFQLVNVADGAPALTVGTDTTMMLSVTNRSGASLALVPGSSVLALRLPMAFFAGELSAMVVTAAGWTAEVADIGVVTLTCSAEGTWAQAATLQFLIAHMRSNGVPGTQPIYLQPHFERGNLPAVVMSSLTLKGKAAAPLPLPMSATLSNGGVIYRSTASDPLVNRLVLNLKNLSIAPLATASVRVGTPRVLVSFIYGSSAGALAPISWPPNDPPPADSAWHIHAAPSVSEARWQTADPAAGASPPVWTLTPVDGNTQLLGPANGDSANFSVEFSEIRSFTEPGNTQMIVLCTGFMRDAETAYDDLVIVLDLTKVDPPATRGLVAFGAQDPVVLATRQDAPLTFAFRWTMYAGVGKVVLVTSSPLLPRWQRTYPQPAGLAYDRLDATLPKPPDDGVLFATLQAFDGNGTFLNQAQFTIAVQLMYVLDRHDKRYAVNRYGNTLWMVEDYAYDTGAGSSVAPGDPPEGPTGRLYEWSAANENAPVGWALPTDADWDALLTDPTWSLDPYAELMPGGASGFDAVLGGTFVASANPQYMLQKITGFYWTARPEMAIQFLSRSKSVVPLGTPRDLSTQMAVRYVRHL
jgi:uncharacterized protein (TIGR02145 family)